MKPCPITNAHLASLFTALLACSDGNVDLGGDISLTQTLERGARCAASPIVTAPVLITNQEELEAMRGCEAVRGSLQVLVFEGTDLSPLASLREVSGKFYVGINGPNVPLEDMLEPEVMASAEANAEQIAQILEAGWLTSLHGVEGLELVGSVILAGVAAPDLGAFESLRNVSANERPSDGGIFKVSGAKNLLDLRGLEGVTGIRSLILQQNPLLESLEGVRLGNMDNVILEHNPSLTDLSALLDVWGLDGELGIRQTAVRDLDGLANLSVAAGGASIVDNAELTRVDGLTNLVSTPLLRFSDNPKLTTIPEFASLSGSLAAYLVSGNASLESVALSFPTAFTTRQLDDAREVEGGLTWFQINDNPNLQTIAVGGTLTSALALDVSDNDRLASIDLGTLRSLNTLSIADNAALNQVLIGSIQTVDLLSVTNNPNLVTAELRNVRTFETVASGNADDPAD